MSRLNEKIDKLHSLSVKMKDCKLIGDSKEWRTGGGLVFAYTYDTEDSDYGDGDYRCINERNIIWVEATGLTVWEGGSWRETGPWQDVAEAAIDDLLDRGKAMIVNHEAEQQRLEEARNRAKQAAHDDLLQRSRQAFGGE
jgi:hypothetical protein